jgi:hypothetical protein
MFENPTVILKALRNSCVKIASFSSELIFTFLYAGRSIQNREIEIHLMYSHFFCKLRPSSKLTNKNLTELRLEIQKKKIWVNIQN